MRAARTVDTSLTMTCREICAVQLQSFRRINQPKARAASNKVKEQWYYDYEPVDYCMVSIESNIQILSKQELRNKRGEKRQRMLGPLSGVGRCCFQLGTTASFMQGRQQDQGRNTMEVNTALPYIRSTPLDSLNFIVSANGTSPSKPYCTVLYSCPIVRVARPP